MTFLSHAILRKNHVLLQNGSSGKIRQLLHKERFAAPKKNLSPGSLTELRFLLIMYSEKKLYHNQEDNSRHTQNAGHEGV